MNKNQEEAPILDAIRAYHESRPVAFRVPGHKSGAGADAVTTEVLAKETFHADIPILDGLDDRRESKRVLKRAEDLAAQAIGADSCHFSVDGSSLSVHALMLAVAGPGDEVLVARNVHRSMIAATILSNVRPVFLRPEYDESWDLEHGIAPEELSRQLTSHPNAKGAFVVCPDYFGVAGNTRALAELCHAKGIPLLVDEAWGPHYPFHPAFPESAIACGADLCCGSFHKTLTALGQASVISRKGSRVASDRFGLVFDLFQSTSPSSLILGLIDGTRRLMATRGRELWEKAIDLAGAVRSELAGFNGLKILQEGALSGKGAVRLDPTKITFDVSELEITGYEACDWLEKNHHLHLELSDQRHLIALITVADDAGSVARLIAAMRELTKAPRKFRLTRRPDFPKTSELYAELVMTPAEAFYAKTEHVVLRRAVGRIAAEIVSPYPPGIPRLIPGEVVTERIVEFFEVGLNEGMFVSDASDTSVRTIRVVA